MVILYTELRTIRHVESTEDFALDALAKKDDLDRDGSLILCVTNRR